MSRGGGLPCRSEPPLGFSVVREELLSAVGPDGRRRNYKEDIVFRKRSG